MFSEVTGVGKSQPKVDTAAPDEIKESYKEEVGLHKDEESADDHPEEATTEVDLSNLTGRQKKLFELRLKMVSVLKA